MGHITTIGYDDGRFASSLEAPKGNDLNQNAWLTLTIRYSLDFADSKNRVAGVIFNQGGKVVAKDSDQPPKFVPIRDWDAESMRKFQRAFQRGEKIWNYQFLLITPKNCDLFDFETSSWVVRPNVLCLFRLEPDFAHAHLPITVVRLREDTVAASHHFRSNERLYDHFDVWLPTLGHELGHALDLHHIKELLGDAKCIADAKKGLYPDRCYGETPLEQANIMGGGSSIYLLNAKPWLDRIKIHTEADKIGFDWKVTGVVNTPPRRLPIEITVVGPKPEF